MEIMFAIRGHKMWLDEFIKELQGKYLPMKLKLNEKGELDPNGKEQLKNVQLGVKPIQLYMVSFPKEHKDLMLATLFGKEKYYKPKYSKFEPIFAMLRKLLKLKKIENYDSSKELPITRENIDTIGIGIHEDKEYGWGEGL